MPTIARKWGFLCTAMHTLMQNVSLFALRSAVIHQQSIDIELSAESHNHNE
jgi:hypothetical protein